MKLWGGNKDIIQFVLWITIPFINAMLIYYNMAYTDYFHLGLLLVGGALLGGVVWQIPHKFKLENGLSVAIFYGLTVFGLGLSQQNTIATGVGIASLIVYYQFAVKEFNEELLNKIKKI